jgi:O-antigen/teichoic acid export membrane protein
MLNVPFSAMYTAKQYIAELTIYSYITTTINAIALYYMVSHPSDWLVRYALLTCLLSVLPQVAICLRSFYVFPECRIRVRYMWDWVRFREVGSFAMYNAMGALCAMLRVQGVGILINKSFGAVVNAAMTIGTSVNAHTASLSSSLMGAFYPAITVAYGEGNLERMRSLSLKACKFGAILFLIFALPLVAELDFILRMWLKNPPSYTGYLCLCVLIMHLMDVATQGHMIAVNASGRVKEYQINMTKISILTLPLAVLTVFLGGGVYGLGILLVGVRASISLRRVYYARLIAGLKWQVWVKEVVLPIALLVVAVALVALFPRLMLGDGFLRVCCVTFIIECVFFLLAWYVVMDCEEREYIKIRVKKYFHY